LETKINALTNLINQLVANQKAAPIKVCGIFSLGDHFMDSCPTLQHVTTSATSDTPQAYAVNIFNNNKPHKKQQNRYLSINRYNPGWRNHPNIRWGN